MFKSSKSVIDECPYLQIVVAVVKILNIIVIVVRAVWGREFERARVFAFSCDGDMFGKQQSINKF